MARTLKVRPMNLRGCESDVKKEDKKKKKNEEEEKAK